MKINPNGFREYDARWLYEKDIDLEGITELGQRFRDSSDQSYKKNKPKNNSWARL